MSNKIIYNPSIKSMSDIRMNSNTINVKIKKTHPEAVIPKYAKPGDAGVDLYCVSRHTEKTGKMNYDKNIVYDTGIAVEIPEGYVGLIFARSSISKYNIWLRNAVGVIDSGYRGNIILKFGYYNGVDTNQYEVGDRVGQLIIMPYPSVNFEEVEELTDSVRGNGGFGSTGEK